jgi:hypothetical protein
VKLPQLLSQFLYKTKRLDLPGIGSFTLDPDVVIPEESDKDMKTIASGITFKNANIQEPDDALVQFIKEHTGKMKSLAAADLDFFLSTGKQLLNIGKIFYLDGIGSLVKNNDGLLEFDPGEYSTTKLEEPDSGEKKDRTTIKNPSFKELQNDTEPQPNTVRQLLLFGGIIGGLIIIGWGGYSLYKNNTIADTSNMAATVEKKDSAPQVRSDSTTISSTGQQANTAPGVQTDSPSPAAAVPPANSNIYKFIILETTRKNRALRRYNQLLGFQLAIKMETKDSSYFKLYFSIPAAARDTAYIKDSLKTVYAANVSIER